MKQSSLKVLFGAVIVLALASCRTAPVYNVDGVSHDAPASATVSDVEGAIKRAGSRLGWRMKDIGPGHLEARLPIRSHLAVADVTFNTMTFSIFYKDSTNLRHNPDNNTIHSNYSGWIQNLENAIVAEASSL